jgi:protein TonB
VYQPKPSPRDRAATIAGVVAIHLGLAFALINLSGPVREVLPAEVVEIFDVTETPPPPPQMIEEIPAPREAEPEPEEREASPENIRSRATPVVAPKPPIQLPIPVPIPVTQTPGQGSERTQGASDRIGPGTGAGGVGTGTGGGGSGGGGGGGGGQAAGVKLVRGITSRDYPPAIAQGWPRGGRVFVRVRVQPDGKVSQCDVMRSFGDPATDQWTCSLILSRGQFRPATDDNGRPIAAWFGYVQSDVSR